MIFLVDGHNLIGKTPGLSLGDVDDEEQLVALLDSACRRLRKKAIVFFDPGAHSGQTDLGSSWVQVRFAHGKADDALVAYLEKQSDRAACTVVTSDQPLARRVRQLRGKVQSSESFAEELRARAAATKSRDEEEHSSPAEVEELLELFEARKTGKKRKAN